MRERLEHAGFQLDDARTLNLVQLVWHEAPVLKGSPWPHPEILRQYNVIVPDAAERLFDRIDREQKHRHEIDKNFLSRSYWLHHLGQLTSVIISALGLVAAYFMVAEGFQWAGAVVGAAAVGNTAISTLLVKLGRGDRS